MRKLSDILAILKRAGYVDVEVANQNIIEKIKFLPLGSILLRKIRNECHLDRGDINTYTTNIENGLTVDLTEHRENTFAMFKTEKFRETLLQVKNQFQSEVPLAIKQCMKFTSQPVSGIDKFSVNITEGTLLSCAYFVNENSATEYFHKIQRERKIWWMKLSLNPGRYFLSDMTTEELNNSKIQSVRIKSAFNDGEMDLEHICVLPLRALGLANEEDFLLKDTRLGRHILPAVVRSEVCLEAAVLGILMDSVEDTIGNKIKINRKVAPYQCVAFCFSEELEELAKHLTNVVRKVGLTSLNLQNCHTDSESVLITELKDMDGLGIPYSIILDDESLRSGLMKLRSRDTGLSEIVHITDVPDYLLKIFKS